METDKFCSSSYKRLNYYIFAVKGKTLKLGLFTNYFKVLFPGVSIVFRYLAYIKILNYYVKGLMERLVYYTHTQRSQPRVRPSTNWGHLTTYLRKNK